MFPLVGVDSLTAANPTFAGDLIGNFAMTLLVVDALGNSVEDQVLISVLCPWPGDIDLYNIEAFGWTEETSYDRIVAELYRVKLDAEVTFRAGELIVLGEDFVVESGGMFTAIIDPAMACQFP